MLRRGSGPLVMLALAAVGAWALWAEPGLINTRAGGDSPFLLIRLQQLVVSLEAGVFPARWMPDAAYGHGYPFFHYYASFPYYLAAALKLWGLGYLLSLKLIQSLGLLGAGAGLYWLARRLGLSLIPAVAGALAYVYAPFHLVNLYVRGDSLGEFYAFAFYPLIFGALLGVSQRPTARGIALLGLSYAGLVLSHNISALIFTPFVGLYALALFLSQPRREVGMAMGAGLGLGLALSAWFWVPALAERGLVQLEEAITGYFHFSNHFRGVDLVQGSLLFDYSTDLSRNPFAMGLVQAMLAAAALGILVWSGLRRRRPHTSTVVLFLAFLFSTFLILPISRPLWETVPLLPFVQFPWRFLSVQAFAASALLALALGELPRRILPQLGLIVVGVVLASSLAGLKVEYLAIEEGDITAARLALYEYFTRNIGSTVRQEYLPRWVETRPFTSSLFSWGTLNPIPLEGVISSARLERRAPGEQVWELEVGSSRAQIAFPVYYFPGWQAYAEGEKVVAQPVEGTGLLGLTLEKGRQEVVLRWGTTPLRAAVELVSALALALVAGMGLRGLAVSRRSAVSGALIGVVVVVGSLVARGTGGSSPPRFDDLSMDYRLRPFLHHNPKGIGFDEAPRLLSYEYSQAEVAAGDTLEVALRWEAAQGSRLRAEVRLVGPITVVQELLGIEDVLAEETSALERETTQHRLRVPLATPAGLYFVGVRLLRGDEVLAPADGGGQVYLRPIRVSSWRPLTGNEPRLASLGESIILSAVETRQVDARHLLVRPTWYTTRPLARDYAVSLRLYDEAGELLTSRDTQPGYGFFPTSVWPVDQLITDRLQLDLPAGTPPGDEYALELILYQVADLEPIGVAHSEGVSLPLFDRVEELSPVHLFDNSLALLRVEPRGTRLQQGEPLVVEVGWSAYLPIRRDLELIWGLIDAGGRRAFEQVVPITDAVPTSRWPRGAFVRELYSLQLPDDLLPGTYQLILGARQVNQPQALQGEYTWRGEIQIERAQRTFTPPEMEYPRRVDFAGQIELLGVDVERRDEDLWVTLHWRALRDIEENYSFFLHLFDPATERIVAQWDGVPRDYPTSRWVAGEIVSAQIGLDLEGLEAGSYRLATGIYDPRTGARLAARGEAVDRDRATLIEEVAVP